jgi:hypothetical protein
MKKLLAFLVPAGLLVYALLSYHIILTDSGLRFLKKASMSLEDTYVDARGAKKVKLFLNPALVEAGIKQLLNEEGIQLEK